MARIHIIWNCVATACFFLAFQSASIKADGGGYFRRYTKTALTDAAGHNVGYAIIWSNRTSSVVQVNLRNLPNGKYFVTIHAGSTCAAHDFSSAGGPLILTWKPEEANDPGVWNASGSPIGVSVTSHGSGENQELVPHIGLKGARSVVGRTFIVTEFSKSATRKLVACGIIGPAS